MFFGGVKSLIEVVFGMIYFDKYMFLVERFDGGLGELFIWFRCVIILYYM